MHRLGYGDDKISLVVNRHQKSDIDLQAVADNLGVAVHAALANDYATALKAINRGLLLRDVAPRAKLVENVARVARLLSGAPAETQKRSGLLRGWFTRASAGAAAIAETKDEGEAIDEPERAPEAV
jgi:pilus assembly protein CpaE